MPYTGEVLVVQRFIKDMTGQELRTELVREALKKAEEYREREKQYERDPSI